MSYWGDRVFLAMPIEFLQSRAFASMTRHEHQCIAYLLSQIRVTDGRIAKGNGSLTCTVAGMQQWCGGMAESAITKAMHGLTEKGIALRAPYTRGRRGAMYAVTFLAIDPDAWNYATYARRLPGRQDEPLDLWKEKTPA